MIIVLNNNLQTPLKETILNEEKSSFDVANPSFTINNNDKKIQFGSKWLHRGAIELGWNFYGNDTISLMFSHVSHGSLLDEKNHGMDEFGIRYGYRF